MEKDAEKLAVVRLRSMTGGMEYLVTRREEGYHFLFYAFPGMDPGRTVGAAELLRESFTLCFNEVRSFTLEMYDRGTPRGENGEIHIRAGKRSDAYFIESACEEARLLEFFEDIGDKRTEGGPVGRRWAASGKKSRELGAWIRENQDRRLLRRLAPVVPVLTMTASLAAFAALMYPAPYRFLMWLLLCIFALSLLLPTVCPAYFTFLGTKQEARELYGSPLICTLLPAVISLTALTFRALEDFCYVDMARLFLITALFIAALVLLAMVFCREAQCFPLYFALLCALTGMLFTGPVGQLNYLLAPETPDVSESAVVTEMGLYKGGGTGYVTLDASVGEVRLDVSLEFYESTYVGDAVRFDYWNGALGVAWAELVGRSGQRPVSGR